MGETGGDMLRNDSEEEGTDRGECEEEEGKDSEDGDRDIDW